MDTVSQTFEDVARAKGWQRADVAYLVSVPFPKRHPHQGKFLPHIDARSQQTRLETDHKGRKRYVDYKNLMIATNEEIDQPSLQALVDHVSSIACGNYSQNSP